MNILIVAATDMELLPLQQKLASASVSPSVSVHFLVTGIGLTATAYHLTKAIQQRPYDLVLNVGIAGSFTNTLGVGDVCVVQSEVFADTGIQTEQGFQTLFESGLLAENQAPFSAGRLECRYVNEYKAIQHLAKAAGATVGTVSGSKDRVALMMSKYKPDVESMEGAAVFYVCLQEDIPFLEFRSISNRVGVRDKSQWNIPAALNRLAEETVSFILTLG